jgi:hypothetical protein
MCASPFTLSINPAPYNNGMLGTIWVRAAGSNGAALTNPVFLLIDFAGVDLYR